MEKNVSSQQNINDSSEIDKLKTELKHVQSVSFVREVDLLIAFYLHAEHTYLTRYITSA